MTIATSTGRIQYSGNGVTTEFATNFKLLDEDHVEVTLTSSAGADTVQTISTNYTVTLGASTATVTMVTPPASEERLTLRLNVPLTQTYDLVNGQAFNADTIETALDLGTQVDQSLQEQIDRAVKLPPSDNTYDLDGLIANVQAVTAYAANIGTVADNMADITTVADDIADVTTVADNLTDITNFADVYLGPSAADPATRTDSSALQEGDMYFNTTNNEINIYNGSTWVVALSADVTNIDFTQDGTGAVLSDVDTKLKEKVSPEDFGAAGDGVTDDTTAFTNMLAAHPDIYVDLGGRTYLVDTVPTTGTFYNGFFKVGPTTTVRANGEFKLHGVKSHTPINLYRDMQDARSPLRFDLTRLGTGKGNAVQSIAVDEIRGDLYTIHVTGSPQKSVINRFNLYGDVVQTAIDCSPTNQSLGHQGLGLEYLEDGNIKLWTSAPRVDGQGTNVVRFDYTIGAPGENNATTGNIETFQLFPTDPTANQNTTPCISYCNRYLIAKNNEVVNGVDGSWIRVFDLEDIREGGAGNYSDKYLVEFFVQVTNGSGVIGFQGMACDGAYIYVLGGGYDIADDYTIAVYSLTGEFIGEHRDINVGRADAAAVSGTSVYEPESFAIMDYNGAPTLLFSVNAGDAPFRKGWVYGIGMGKPMRSQPGDFAPSYLSESSNMDLAVPSGDDLILGGWDSSTDTYTSRLTLKSSGELDFDGTGNSGTWTVGAYDAVSGGNASPTTGTGQYFKFGNMVWINLKILNIDTTGMTGSNPLFIRGHGFNPSNRAILPAPLLGRFTPETGSIRLFADISTAGNITVREVSTSNTDTVATVTQFDGSDILLTGWFQI